jgi:hypothetical protein
MSHFNVKSLAFYGIAISSVVVLFSVVSAYGNANLKAPPAVDGRYRLNAQNLPGCLKSEALILTIQQSGEYLGGVLSPANAIEKKGTQKKSTLTGELQNQQLSLSGPVPELTSCNKSTNSTGTSRGSTRVKIQGKVEGKTLNGQIALNSTPTTAEFTAQLEPPEEKPENKH